MYVCMYIYILYIYIYMHCIYICVYLIILYGFISVNLYICVYWYIHIEYGKYLGSWPFFPMKIPAWGKCVEDVRVLSRSWGWYHGDMWRYNDAVMMIWWWYVEWYFDIMIIYIYTYICSGHMMTIMIIVMIYDDIMMGVQHPQDVFRIGA